MTNEEKTTPKNWIKTKPAELQKLVIDLAKQGISPAKIGLILRDKHGIPKSKLLGKKITQILKESNTEYVTEKQNVDKKINILKDHISKNKHDYSASKALTKKLWVLYNINKSQKST